MDGLHEFLETLRRSGSAQGNLLGLLNILIGRRIESSQGKIIAAGLSWRAAAMWLKKVRWDKETVRELGLDPRALPPRDRERFWYQAIAQAGVDSPAAAAAGDRLAETLTGLGYVVGPAPR
jgi:hypothetical protein